jgi:hypothetical protein
MGWSRNDAMTLPLVDLDWWLEALKESHDYG